MQHTKTAAVAVDDDSTPNIYPLTERIGFIGAGNMAQAMIGGFISKNLVNANQILVSAPSMRNLEKLSPLGVKTTHDNNIVVNESDIVFLAVKPYAFASVLNVIEPLEGNSHQPLFVSVAAGLSINSIEEMLEHVASEPRVIRVMPNTPCMVLEGCCAYALGTHAVPRDGKILREILSAIGVCEEVPEHQIDAVGGVAGSGPAYIYAAIEAMADGAVKMGLPRNIALKFAAQTVRGAATMVLNTGKHPGQLKDEVCSPSGVTIAAMHVLEKNAFRNSLISAVEASTLRAKELA